MTLIELEYVATCPNRFAVGLKNELNFLTPLAPVCTEILEITTRNHSLPLGEFAECLTLVLGGRFLLTITDSKLLQFWDLGYAFKRRMDKPLAFTSLLEKPIWADARPSTDNKELIVGVASAE